MATKKLHLVALALSAEGHVTPMMHLCGYLSKHHNFSITLVLLEGNSKLLGKILSKRCWPPPGTDITLIELEGDSGVAFPERAPSDLWFDLTQYFQYLKLKHRDTLKQFLNKQRSVHCLLCDHQLSWSLDIVDIPGAIFFTSGITYSWFELNMPRLVSSGAVPMQDFREFLEQDYEILEQPVKLMRSDIGWHFWNNKNWLEYTITNSGSKVFKKARWTLISSCEELEPGMTGAMAEAIGGDIKLLPVGPLFLLNDSPENVGFSSFDPKCIQWLDEQAAGSVLYIAFGSVADLSTGELEEFSQGLVASKCKFLWVVKESEDKNITGFYEMFGDENKQQGFITHWAPQTRVLSHPAVAAFLSHCGWNSTMEGISSGQVILCWPWYFEQNLNRSLILQWKVGFGFDKSDQGKVGRKEVERVVRMAMQGDEGKEARQRVKDLSAKVRQAVSSGGSSSRNILRFINELEVSTSSYTTN